MGNHSSKDKAGLAFFQKTVGNKPPGTFIPTGKQATALDAALKLPADKQYAAVKAAPDGWLKDQVMENLLANNPTAYQQNHDSLPQFMQDALDGDIGYTGQVHPAIVGSVVAAGALYWDYSRGLQLSFFNAGIAFVAGWVVGDYFQISREKSTVNPFVVLPVMVTRATENVVWFIMQIIPGIFQAFWNAFTGITSGVVGEIGDWFSHHT